MTAVRPELPVPSLACPEPVEGLGQAQPERCAVLSYANRIGTAPYSAQTTTPLHAVASTTMPNAMRYQAKGTKLLVEM